MIQTMRMKNRITWRTTMMTKRTRTMSKRMTMMTKRMLVTTPTKGMGKK